MNRATIQRLLREWQKRLWLEHWDVVVLWDETVPSSNAEISPNPYRQNANLQLNPAWKTWTIERANYLIVHELLHCSDRGIDNVLEVQLEGQLHRDLQTVIEEAYTLEMERFIDDQARILVKGYGIVR